MPMGTTWTRPAWSAPGSASRPALAAPKVTVRSAESTGACGLPGVGVHAAGDVAGHHQAGRAGRTSQSRHQGGSGSPQPALGARPQDSVNHDVGTRHLRGELADVRVGEEMHPPAGTLKSSQRLGVGGVPGEYRRRTHSPGGQERGGEEAVSAVVALAGEDGHAGAVEPPAAGLQLVDDGVGEPVGGALHQDGAHPGCQERLFGALIWVPV